MAGAKWEFWIDVGGTFTDCLAKAPDGSIRRHKLLSSGATKGRVGNGSSRDKIHDPLRRHEPLEFWTGWQLAIIGDHAEEIGRAVVTGFDAASGQLHVSGLSKAPEPNAAYELRSELEAPVVA